MEHLTEKFDLFIFDWDGTVIRLYNHVRLYGRLISALMKLNKSPKLYDKDFEPPEEFEAKENYLFSLFLNFFIERLSTPHLNSYVKEGLIELRKKHKRAAILSNGNKQRILKKMEKAGLGGDFDIVVSTKDLHAAKPNPAGLTLVLKLLKEKPERSIYIGDKTGDILAAKYAKIHSCGIADGFDSPERLKSVGPDYIFKNMEEFYKAL